MREIDLSQIDGHLGHTKGYCFSSLSDVMTQVESNQISHYLFEKNAEWVGRSFKSFSEIENAVQSRWHQGEQWADEMHKQISEADFPVPMTRKRQRCWREDNGDDICLDRMRSGQQFWRSSHRARQSGSGVFTIVCQTNALSRVKSRDLLWRGVGAMIMTEMLERAGYRVELWGATYAHGTFANKGSVLVATQLKHARSALDRVAVLNAVSGWFFRTVGFNQRYLLKRNPHEGSAGYTEPMTDEHLDTFCSGPRVLIDGCYDLHSTVERMTEILNNFKGN